MSDTKILGSRGTERQDITTLSNGLQIEVMVQPDGSTLIATIDAEGIRVGDPIRHCVCSARDDGYNGHPGRFIDHVGDCPLDTKG